MIISNQRARLGSLSNCAETSDNYRELGEHMKVTHGYYFDLNLVQYNLDIHYWLYKM
jgi:hypothetical protein